MTVLDQNDPQTYAVIGAAMEVSRVLGPGFLEAVYQESLALEMRARGIPFAREVPITITYKGTALNCPYRADFICYGEIIVEIKAVTRLSPVEEAQVLNYLKATGLRRSLLLNFGKRELEIERRVLG